MNNSWNWTIKGTSIQGEQYVVSADYDEPLSVMAPTERHRWLGTMTLEESAKVTLEWLRKGWER